jgi:quercetin dioxygenase-like cupin family protein
MTVDAAEPRNFSQIGGIGLSGPKARDDFVGFMRGLKQPPPRSVSSFPQPVWLIAVRNTGTNGEGLGETRHEIDRGERKRMEIKRIGSQASGKGPADWFTGTVRIDPLFTVPDPARVVGASVTFEPGARTAWHTHPLGQTLVVTAGCGRAQHWGGPIEQIRPGDVIWFAPGEKHWHGAAPTTAMTHFAIQEKLDGKTVDWLEHVSDEQYGA